MTGPTKISLIFVQMWSLKINDLAAKGINLYSGTITFTQGPSTLYLNTNTSFIRSQNTFVALRGFHVKNDFMNWKIDMTPATSIQATTTNTHEYFQFAYIIFRQPQCSTTTPYLMLSQSLCYDVCPTGYKGDEASQTCKALPPTPTPTPPDITPPPQSSQAENHKILYIAIGCSVGLVLIIWFLFKAICTKTRRGNTQSPTPDEAMVTEGQIKRQENMQQMPKEQIGKTQTMVRQ